MDGSTAFDGCRIGFIGGGNMAEALIRGLLEAGAVRGDSIRVSDPLEARREQLIARYGVAASDDNAVVAAESDLLVLAVKPQILSGAMASLVEAVRPQTLVVSICAGVRAGVIEEQLAAGARVVRAMPNTAAIALAGASAIAKGACATDSDLGLVKQLFEAVGCCVVVAEGDLDAVTGLSGSGPAYVMLVIEALVEGGVEAGLSREVALCLAAQTVYGAAKLQLETGDDPARLRERVTSPGGTTVAGLAQLDEAGVRAAFVAAVRAATARSLELGQQ